MIKSVNGLKYFCSQRFKMLTVSTSSIVIVTFQIIDGLKNIIICLFLYIKSWLLKALTNKKQPKNLTAFTFFHSIQFNTVICLYNAFLASFYNICRILSYKLTFQTINGLKNIKVHFYLKALNNRKQPKKLTS
jgi:hypothetical protein